MNDHHTAARAFSKLHICAAAALLAMGSVPVQSALGATNDFQLPRVPLQSGNGVPPNIMFILDDSGSMHAEIIPDERMYPTGASNLLATAWFLFPRRSNVYGAGDYNNRNNVVTFNSQNPYARISRSAHFNPLAYDPSKTYRPWVRHDGTLYPNAVTTAAYLNPENTSAGTRDLTRELTKAGEEWANNWFSCTAANTCSQEAGNAANEKTFFPAVYAFYRGTNEPDNQDWNIANFDWVEIRDGNTYTGHGRAARTDCDNGSCTYAQEIQNFANWHTYYRSRILASRAGIGRAFQSFSQAPGIDQVARVGFASINTASSTDLDGESSPGTLVSGVRPFVGEGRRDWFSRLYTTPVPADGTPLRRALDDVGQYFSRADAKGPWSTTPGAEGGEILACRQSFSILMTDGYYTYSTNATDDVYGRARTAGARADNDSLAGDEIARPDLTTYRYQPVGPFRDSRAGTLADVAMYYWKRDLLPETPNRVPTSAQNPAFWQHMVTYGVGLGVRGTPGVTFDSVLAKVGSEEEQVWANPLGATTAFAPAKIDDLMHAAINSRGGFFSVEDPDSFAEELGRTLSSISERTASGSNVAANSVALREETRIFQASYVGGQWTGELASYRVTAAGVDAEPAWRASAGSNYLPHATRRVYTFNGSTQVVGGAAFPAAGVRAAFPNTQTQTPALGLPANVASYIRGDVSAEQRNGGALRNRSTLLGDIIHSSPVYVAGDEDRNGMLYVGSNNGMLHAFRIDDGRDLDAGEEGGGAAFTEQEVFSYIPGALKNTELVGLSSPDYAHRFFVDGGIAVSRESQTPGKRILVGTIGRGADQNSAGAGGPGAGIFAIDVTDPEGVTGPKVLWDSAAWRPATTGSDRTDSREFLGVSLGEPLIIRTNAKSGNNNIVAAVFGNGINSASGDPALFVVNLETGAVMKRISARNDTGNGIVSIRALDYDNDGIHDYVYGADVKGNIWKFDLDSAQTNNWEVANNGQPIFTTRAQQPITGGFAVALDPEDFTPWVFVGTGKYLEMSDVTSRTQQSWYGFRDEGATVTHAQLRMRKVHEYEMLDGRRVRGFDPNGPLATLDEDGNIVGELPKGWFIDLDVPAGTTPSERMIGNPLMVGRVLVNASVYPSADPCESGGSGYLNAIDAFTGTSVASPFFDVRNNGEFDETVVVTDADGNQVTVPVGSVGVNVGMPTSPTVVENLLIVGGSEGTTDNVGINNPLMKGRVSWREVVTD